MADLPPDEPSRRLQLRTLYVAIAALVISMGHVVYAFLRDRVFD